MLVDVVGNVLRSQKREVVISDPKLVTFAAQAETAFRHLELGVVCVHCGQPPRMGNAPTDANWKMECACSVRVLRNPAVKREKILS